MAAGDSSGPAAGAQGGGSDTDTFVRDRLPPREQWPDLVNLDRLGYPDRLNYVAELLDGALARGWGDRPCLSAEGVRWTYADLAAEVNRIASVLVDDHGLRPGERVLLRAANTPMMAATYLAVGRAGGVTVATMPLLRAVELATIVKVSQARIAICDTALADELMEALRECPSLTDVILTGGDGEFERRVAAAPPTFPAVDTAADDPCLIAFTSGTTGRPKAAVHMHRSVLAACDCYPPAVLATTPDDVFIGSPPLAFTFGTGGLLWFPLRAGASVHLVAAPSPPALAAAIESARPTICFTSPTAYRMMADTDHDLSSLRLCVSAGETLPVATYERWRDRTGLPIIDGIGATEMLHIFISGTPDAHRPGTTGKPVPGYEAKVVDDDGERVVGEVGRLVVRGPTGCLYLDDPRQTTYVRDGWNHTGDAYVEDADGWFTYRSRTDDLIVSGGYNIAGPEVEDVLLSHEAVAECAVVGLPDDVRGQVVTAFVVLRDGHAADEATAAALQAHAKAAIAPYKYPRRIEFIDALPRTATGKVRRHQLRAGGAA